MCKRTFFFNPQSVFFVYFCSVLKKMFMFAVTNTVTETLNQKNFNGGVSMSVMLE